MSLLLSTGCPLCRQVALRVVVPLSPQVAEQALQGPSCQVKAPQAAVLQGSAGARGCRSVKTLGVLQRQARQVAALQGPTRGSRSFISMKMEDAQPACLGQSQRDSCAAETKLPRQPRQVNSMLLKRRDLQQLPHYRALQGAATGGQAVALNEDMLPARSSLCHASSSSLIPGSFAAHAQNLPALPAARS